MKTQTGHAEACAALLSLVKVLLAMDAGMLPGSLQYEIPNPEIKGLSNGNLQVVTKNTKWNSEYVAVNALGICNYLGHIVLKRSPKQKSSLQFDIPVLLPVSSRTEDAIKTILNNVSESSVWDRIREKFNLCYSFSSS